MKHSYDLKVKVEHPLAPYLPGSTVKGQVELTLTESMPVKEITVLLKGETESCNVRKTTEYNHTNNRYQTRKVMKVIQCTLFERGIILHPANAQESAKTENHFLPMGTHTFPFELSFPEGKVEAKYAHKQDSSLRDVAALVLPLRINPSVTSQTGLLFTDLPPSFLVYFGSHDYANVNYILKAKVKRVGVVNPSFSDSVSLSFSPNEESITESHSVNYALISSTFKDGTGLLKLLPYRSRARPRRSLLDRMFDISGIKVPFGAEFELKQPHTLHPNGGHFLCQGDNLALFVALKLLTPFSVQSLRRLLVGYSSQNELDAVLPLIVLKRMSVALVKVVRYQGAEEKTDHREFELYARPCNTIFNLSDLRAVENPRNPTLYKHVRSEHSLLVSKGKAYEFEVPPALLHYEILFDGQSFKSPAVLCEIYLKAKLVLSSTEQNSKEEVVSGVTPICLLPDFRENPVPFTPPSALRTGTYGDVPPEALPTYEEVMQNSQA